MSKPLGMEYARIIGTGSALPREAVSNAALAARLAKDGVMTSDDWIVERTGIRQRHLAAEDETTVSLAETASKRALEAAGIAADQLDLIIVATSTPDVIFPSTACLLQARLGNRGAACFDMQAVCSGFVYALGIADQFIRCGTAKHVLVVGSEVFSRIMDWQDRTTCVLFGDGAGAVVLRADSEPGVLAHRLHADGSHAGVLRTAGHVRGGQVSGHPFLTMDGQAVFKLAVSSLDSVAREVLDAASLQPSDIDWLIPHQANIRILNAVGRKLGVSEQRVVVTVDQHGNTSAASVPLALDQAVRDGRIRSGQHVMLQGVGGGFTWGAALVRM